MNSIFEIEKYLTYSFTIYYSGVCPYSYFSYSYFSIDYLVLDVEQPRLVDLQDREFIRYFKSLEGMSEKDREVIKSLINAYLKKSKLEAILAE